MLLGNPCSVSSFRDKLRGGCDAGFDWLKNKNRKFFWIRIRRLTETTRVKGSPWALRWGGGDNPIFRPNVAQIAFSSLHIFPNSSHTVTYMFLWDFPSNPKILFSQWNNLKISTLFTPSGPFSSSEIENNCLSAGTTNGIFSLLCSSQKENKASNQWQVQWKSFVKYSLTQFWGCGGLKLWLLFNFILEPVIPHSVWPHEIVRQDSTL